MFLLLNELLYWVLCSPGSQECWLQGLNNVHITPNDYFRFQDRYIDCAFWFFGIPLWSEILTNLTKGHLKLLSLSKSDERHHEPRQPGLHLCAHVVPAPYMAFVVFIVQTFIRWYTYVAFVEATVEEKRTGL